MDEEVLSALRSLCSFLGVTLEECILTCFSLGGGVEPMQLIISQSLRAVRGLMAELNRATIQPRVEIPVDVPTVVPETSEICVAALIGITQALEHNGSSPIHAYSKTYLHFWAIFQRMPCAIKT